MTLSPTPSHQTLLMQLILHVDQPPSQLQQTIKLVQPRVTARTLASEDIYQHALAPANTIHCRLRSNASSTSLPPFLP